MHKGSFLIILLFVFSVIYCSGQVSSWSQVGPDAMPRRIAPVKAPFYVPSFSRPVFPDRILSIEDYGAREGGEYNCRNAINTTITVCAQEGGGQVLIPAGKWLTGRIELKSNVELHLDEGAELFFSGEVEDYQPAVFCRIAGVEVMSLGAFIYAFRQENIAITGLGKIIGPPKDAPIREINAGLDMDRYVSFDSPVESRIFDGLEGRLHCLPYSLSPIECRNVFIESVTLERSAMWNIVPVYCRGVIIRGVRINSVGVPAGDGINIDSSRDVLVEYCMVRTGDDSYCLKAGRNEDGLRVGKSTENVVHRFNVSMQGHGGITFGSETAGMIRNVYVINCVYENVRYGIRFKTRRPRGGGGENIGFENISIQSDRIIVWDMLGSERWVGKLARRLPPLDLTPLTPVFKDIFFRSIEGKAKGELIIVKGIPESPVQNIIIENSRLEGSGGIFLNDCKEFTLRNIRFRCDSKEILSFRNVQHFNTPDCLYTGKGGTSVSLAEGSCRDIDLSLLKFSGNPFNNLQVNVFDGARNDCIRLPEEL